MCACIPSPLGDNATSIVALPACIGRHTCALQSWSGNLTRRSGTEPLRRSEPDSPQRAGAGLLGVLARRTATNQSFGCLGLLHLSSKCCSNCSTAEACGQGTEYRFRRPLTSQGASAALLSSAPWLANTRDVRMPMLDDLRARPARCAHTHESSDANLVRKWIEARQR